MHFHYICLEACMITKYNQMFSGNGHIRWFKYTSISQMDAVSITRFWNVSEPWQLKWSQSRAAAVHLNHLTKLSAQENFTPFQAYFTDMFRTTFNNDRINHADQPYIRKFAIQFHAVTPWNKVLCDCAVSWKTQETWFSSWQGQETFRHAHKIVTNNYSLHHVRLSARKNLAPPLNMFNEIWYSSIFSKSVKKIQVSLKFDKNNGYFTWWPMYIYGHIF